VEIAAEFEVTRGRVLGLVEQMAVCRALIAVTAERDRLLLQMDNLRSRIRSDAYAMSFQTMGQYRTALLNAFPRPCSICSREDCTVLHECE
jgi:hypothetical protein